MKFRNSFISISLATLLIGCGSDSSSGGAKSSLICLDANMNGICESAETSKNVKSWKDGATLSSSQYPLAYKGLDGLLLTAPVGSDEISPWAALLQNEIRYNPEVTDVASATSYLASKGITKPTDLSTLEALIKSATDANADANIYTIISELTDKIVTKGSIDSSIVISVNKSFTKLKTSEAFSVDFSSEIETREALGWTEADDSAIGFLSAKNGHLVGGSFWHNALSVIDTGAKTGRYSDFGVTPGAGHGAWDYPGDEIGEGLYDTYTDSGAEPPETAYHTQNGVNHDSTGASEHAITDVAVTSSGDFIYVNAPADVRTGEHGGNGWKLSHGLFKVSVSSDGSTADIVAGDMDSVTEDSVLNPVLKKVINDFSIVSLSKDDSTVVALGYSIADSYDDNNSEWETEHIGSANQLFVYNANLEEQTTATIENIGALAVTSDGSSIYASFSDAGSNYISKITTSSLVVDGGQIALDFAPTYIKLISDTKALAANANTITIVDLAASTAESSSPIDMPMSSMDVSPNGAYLVAVSSSDAKLIIINLNESGKDIQHTVTLDKSASAVVFLSDTQIAYTKENNEVAVLNIEDTGVAISVSEKIKSALDKVTPQAMNSGKDMSDVKANLALLKRDGSVNIAWSGAALSNSINLDRTSDTLGAVTRPVFGNGHDVGTLSATASTSYRGETYMATSKDFATTVKQAPKVLPTVNALADTTSIKNLASKADGSILVAPTEYTNGDTTLYGLNSYTIVDGNLSEVSTNMTYANGENIESAYIYGDFVIAQSSTRIFSVAINGNGSLANNIINEIALATAPSSITANSDKSIIGVFTVADTAYTMTPYSINDMGVISEGTAIDLSTAVTYSGANALINDDATKVYLSTATSYTMNESGNFAEYPAAIGTATYFDDRIYLAESKGRENGSEVISLDSSLSSSSKTTYDVEQAISTIKANALGDSNYVYVATSTFRPAAGQTYGVYLLKVEDDDTLQEYGLSAANSMSQLAVSADGQTVFTLQAQYVRVDNMWVQAKNIGVISDIN